MKVDYIKNRKQISADDGIFLCNVTNKVFAHKVCLGVNSTESMWQEITEEEKARLEAEWGTEPEIEEITIEQKAHAYDILMGVSE